MIVKPFKHRKLDEIASDEWQRINPLDTAGSGHWRQVKQAGRQN